MNEEKLAALEAELTDEDRLTLDELAAAIAKRGMVSPALFFFESMVPMGTVGSAVMSFLRPMVGILWRDPKRWDSVARILDKRGTIELMVRRLEALA